MSKAIAIQKLERKYMKQDLPDFRVGDTVKIHTRIIEGEKERVQIFMGTVIARSGYGLSETVSIHRVAYGEGMERVFPLHSPRIAKIEVVKEGKVRRAKLYYLRGTSGKKAKVKGSVSSRRQAMEESVIGDEGQVEGATIKDEPAVLHGSGEQAEELTHKTISSQPVTDESEGQHAPR